MTDAFVLDARRAAAALVLFVALAGLHTWPLASGIGSLSRHDNGDAVLNEWAVAWVAHQLPRDPLHLFDANIFYPEPNTLAFSEHLFVQGVMGAPLLWVGVPTLTVHNLLLLAGFALTGWTMSLVMARATGSWTCGILGGMLLAFNAHTLARVAHLQAVHVQFLPLAMLALDRLLARANARRAMALAVTYVLQGLASNYLLVFTTFGLAAAAVTRPREWFGRGRGRVFVMLLVAAAIAILLLAPFLYHYYLARETQGLSRSLDEIRKYTGSWRDYASATGTIHYRLWSSQFWRGTGTSLFPGLVALALTAVACAAGVAWRNRFARMWVAAGVVGLLLSFGAALPGYSLLYELLPLLQGIRATVRFGFLALAAVAALAAFGLKVVQDRCGDRPRLRTTLTTLALVLVTVEALRIPVGYSEPHHSPSMYAMLKDEAGAVIIELPMADPRRFELNAPYMLHATLHWRPMVNGYSGYLPPSYQTHFERVRAFPDAGSIEYLRALGVTHIAVHSAGFSHDAGQVALAAIRVHPGLRQAFTGPGLTIYRLLPKGE